MILLKYNKLLFFWLSLLLFSCSSELIETKVINLETEAPLQSQTLRYLALGDSYTIGASVAEPDRWPNQLASKPIDSIYSISEVNIIAQTGWTTGNLLQAIENQAPDNHDLVSLLIGVNNQFQKQDFEVFETQLELLIEKAIELASGNRERVFLVSIPDYGVTPFGANNAETIAQELDRYNEHIRLRSEAFDLPFINITEISRSLEGNSDGLASDGLHPSGYQYSLWVEEILPVVKNMLSD